MAVSATDVPSKYDVVIGGYGFTFLRTLDGSYLTSGRHRAEYTYSPTFLERTNVQGDYGDDQQAFWMTATQRDWSLGEQQRYFRPQGTQADSARRFWRGTNVDVRRQGQVKIRSNTGALTFGAAVSACTGVTSQTAASNTVFATSSANLYEVDAAGTITSKGAHGLGATPAKYGVCTDGNYVYMTTTAASTVGVRVWNGASFATFSVTAADSLAFLNNTLFGYIESTGQLVRWDTSGVQTVLYTWKRAGGSAQDYRVRLRAFGSKLAILLDRGVEGAELWIYDGSAPSLAWEMPLNFFANDCDVAYGVLFVSGAFIQSAAGSNSNMVARPAVLYYANGSTGTLWQADDYGTTTFATLQSGPYPGIAPFDDGVVFNDDTRGAIYYYDFSSGGVQTIGTYTVAGSTPLLAASQRHFIHIRNQTAGYFYPDTSTIPATANVDGSLVDFDSSLTKDFRGITIDADIPTGASVDIKYQLDSLDGAYTTLQTGAASGTEYVLASVSGRAIAPRIVLNKGSSTTGPTLKRQYVRAVPRHQAYRFRTYNLDLSNDGVTEYTVLQDGSPQPLSGHTQAVNLQALIAAQAPVTITDRFSTYTGVLEPASCSLLELHSGSVKPTESGSFIATIVCREI